MPRLSRERLLVGAVVLVGAALRLVGLSAESLTNDEVYSLHFVRTYSPLEFLAQYPTIDPHPPLYYLLLDGWTSIAGTSEAAARLPSALFGAAAVWATYRLGQRAFDARVGLVAATCLALSSLHLYHAQEVRMYGLFTLATALSTAAFVGAVEAPDLRHYLWYAGATIVLLYTHVFGAFVVAAHVLFLAIHEREAIVSGPRARLRGWLGVYGLLGVVYLPLVALVVRQALLISESGAFVSWIDPPAVTAVPLAFLTYVGYQSETAILLARAAPVYLLAGVPVAALVLGAARRRSGRAGRLPARVPWATTSAPGEPSDSQDAEAGDSLVDEADGSSPGGAADAPRGGQRQWVLLCCLWIGSVHGMPWLLSHLVTPIYVGRYTISASVAVFLLVGVGVVTVADRFAPSRLGDRRVAVGLALVLVLVLAAPLGSYYADHQRDQWRDAVAYVDGEAGADDAVLVVSDSPELADLRIVYRHYAERDAAALVALGSKEDAYYDRAAEAAASHDRVWLVVGLSHSVTDAERTRFVETLSESCAPLEERRYSGVEVRSFDCGSGAS